MGAMQVFWCKVEKGGLLLVEGRLFQGYRKFRNSRRWWRLRRGLWRPFVEAEAFLLQLLVGCRGVDCLRAVRTSHVYGHAIGLVIVGKHNYKLRVVSWFGCGSEKVLALIKLQAYTLETCSPPIASASISDITGLTVKFTVSVYYSWIIDIYNA